MTTAILDPNDFGGGRLVEAAAAAVDWGARRTKHAKNCKKDC